MKSQISFTKNVIPILLLSLTFNTYAQIADFPPDTVAGILANYTEAKVGEYILPDLLKCADGKIVDNKEIWISKRRDEIIKLFEEYQFGSSPKSPDNIRYKIIEKGASSFDGIGKRTQVTIYFSENDEEPKMDVLIYTPNEIDEPVPVLLYISFSANSQLIDDPNITEGFIWNREKVKIPAGRESRFGKLDVTKILESGFGIATVYYGDIEPDFENGYNYGVRNSIPKDESSPYGSITTWSWGLSRVLDYFENDEPIDEKSVAVMGVSRLGKTALWAGALDTRFALVIPVCSGESGAALSRRNYGETIAHIASPSRYHYWFVPKYQQFANSVSELPVDSHMLISLIAPRPILLITGNTDKWSDPYGEFIAAVEAEKVYKLFGKKGIDKPNILKTDSPVLNDIGFYMHDGGHGMVPKDWDVILDFMKKHL